VPCPIDVTLDGATFVGKVFDPTIPTPNDVCPSVFWVQLNNTAALFSRAIALNIRSGPPEIGGEVMESQCEQDFRLDFGHLVGPVPTIDATLAGTGTYVPCLPSDVLCINVCTGLPSKRLVATDVAGVASLVFAVPASSSSKLLYVFADIPGPVPQ
jgi:hypothetical protein